MYSMGQSEFTVSDDTVVTLGEVGTTDWTPWLLLAAATFAGGWLMCRMKAAKVPLKGLGYGYARLGSRGRRH